MGFMAVTLDDKYTLETGRIYLNGTQALVRLALMQRRRDVAAGLNTAGYVTGYRGSPLGGMDREFTAAKRFLDEHHVKFHPAVNEDLAATALWGSQQLTLSPGAQYDGVFGMWYGKGPGVDRSGDVFRHANMAGTSEHGGVLALAGDDPACKSSTVPSQSEHALMDAHIPILHPANTQELLDYGLYGIAMSRYSGMWTGMKCITDNVDASASVSIDPARVQIVTPEDFEIPPGGLHLRWPDPPVDQEHRLQRHKIYAALAFARANGLNRVTMDASGARFGIISTGKSYLDTLQALEDLGIDEAERRRIGMRVLKIGMPWPLEKDVVRNFAEGLEEVLVVEEKRAVIENQLKEQLYNWRADVRPRVVGKFDELGAWILPSAGELTPARIARVIAARVRRFHQSDAIEARLEFLEAKEKALEDRKAKVERIPYFCSGCPHNTSTKVPEGSRAAAGIGCHYMAIWMDRDTTTFTHMGAEGANWIGQAPFTSEKHIFVNIGDGTYFHSGILALRAAVAAGVNITYKILYNDAVAMTGGQPMDGPLDIPMITRQVEAEGVKRIAIVAEDPDRHAGTSNFAPGTTVHGREDFDAVQREMRGITGVSVIIYDQVCAAEKRRRRKRGLYPDPAKRAFINEAVCEGCGDCGETSNCVSIVPKETELGRKRAIDQSSCNKDFSCVNGFCPSFVTVEGAEPLKPHIRPVGTEESPFPALPQPPTASTAAPYGIMVTGIGGTGVVTVGAVIAMAAHVEGKGVTVLDVAGLAQKNGAVYSHIRVADEADALHAVRIAAGGADLLLGCDMVTAGSAEMLGKMADTRTRGVVNLHQTMTSDFTHDPDLDFPADDLKRTINETTANAHFVDATGLARKLLGDTIGANMFVVGYAAQKGLLPVSVAAMEKAIELNGVAVEFNKQALAWGRRAAHDAAAVDALLTGQVRRSEAPSRGGTFAERRAKDLEAYQDAVYAARYTETLTRVAAAEAERAPGKTGLADTAAQALFKLMAYKDEYEVARLYTDGRFARQLRETFTPGGTLRFHLAPPLLAERDPATGHLRKKEYGAWVLTVFKVLAKFKGLRGTAWDPFGRSEERRRERALIGEYEATLETLLGSLSADNHALACEIAALPLQIRGFGHVKEANLAAAKDCEAKLLAEFSLGGRTVQAAE